MKLKSSLLTMAGAVAMFFSPLAHADQASGIFTNNLGALIPLYDASGSYSNFVDIFGYNFTVNELASGKMAGTGTFSVVGGFGIASFDVTNGTVKVTGLLTGNDINPKVSLTFTGSGSGTGAVKGINAEVPFFKQTSHFNGAINSTNGELIGNLTISGVAKFVDAANAKKQVTLAAAKTFKNVTFSLPTNAVPTNWILTLPLTPNGDKGYAVGTATIMTSIINGITNTADLNVIGTYNSKADTSTIHLIGSGTNKGASLTLGITTSGTNLTVDTIAGTILGQTVKYKAP